MFMKHALDAAKNCENEIAIGAVIVKDNEIIASACNRKETLNDVSAHAEILALREAAKKLGSWRLYDCDLYVTLKPCSMCEIIIKQARIKNVYYLLEKLNSKKDYNKTNFIKISENEQMYYSILQDFFKKKRDKK